MDYAKKIFLIAVFVVPVKLLAQGEDLYALKDLVHDSREEIEALALYPNDIRDAIFEVVFIPN